MNANLSAALVLALSTCRRGWVSSWASPSASGGGGGGLIVAALAPLADRAGLGAVLYLIAVLMLFAAATAASLPRPVASPPETLRSLRAEVQF